MRRIACFLTVACLLTCANMALGSLCREINTISRYCEVCRMMVYQDRCKAIYEDGHKYCNITIDREACPGMPGLPDYCRIRVASLSQDCQWTKRQDTAWESAPLGTMGDAGRFGDDPITSTLRMKEGVNILAKEDEIWTFYSASLLNPDALLFVIPEEDTAFENQEIPETPWSVQLVSMQSGLATPFIESRGLWSSIPVIAKVGADGMRYVATAEGNGSFIIKADSEGKIQETMGLGPFLIRDFEVAQDGQIVVLRDTGSSDEHGSFVVSYYDRDLTPLRPSTEIAYGRSPRNSMSKRLILGREVTYVLWGESLYIIEENGNVHSRPNVLDETSMAPLSVGLMPDGSFALLNRLLGAEGREFEMVRLLPTGDIRLSRFSLDSQFARPIRGEDGGQTQLHGLSPIAVGIHGLLLTGYAERSTGGNWSYVVVSLDGAE